MKAAAKLTGILLALLIFVPSVPVYAEGDANETYTLTTTDVRLQDDGSYAADYDEEITIDGVLYKFDNIVYTEENLKKKVLTEDSEVQYLDVYTDEDGNEVKTEPEEPEFPETIEKDGVTYVLTGTKTETKVKEGRTVSTKVIEQRNATTNGDAKTEIEAEEYIDPDTGNKKKLEEGETQMIPFVSSELKSEGWGSGDLKGNMQVKDYQYLSYMFQGVEIPRNEARPLEPAQYPLVLSYLELDPQLFRITDVSWAGDAFIQNGTYVRNASITGDIYNRNYDDTFMGTVTIPDITYTYTVATYEESDEDFFERSNVTAVITYVKAGEEAGTEEESTDNPEPDKKDENKPENRSSFAEFISSPAGIFTVAVSALVIAAVIIVLVIAGKRKKKDGKK